MKQERLRYMTCFTETNPFKNEDVMNTIDRLYYLFGKKVIVGLTRT